MVRFTLLDSRRSVSDLDSESMPLEEKTVQAIAFLSKTPVQLENISDNQLDGNPGRCMGSYTLFFMRLSSLILWL